MAADFNDLIEDLSRDRGRAVIEATEAVRDIRSRLSKSDDVPYENDCELSLQIFYSQAAILANIMPFSFTGEILDERGPVVQARLKLGGEDFNVEAFCNGSQMMIEEAERELDTAGLHVEPMDTLDALSGLAILYQIEKSQEEDADRVREERNAQCRSENRPKLPDASFTLQDESGELRGAAEIIDRPALIFFGYSASPEAGISDAFRNVEVRENLAGSGIDVLNIYISIDSIRDTPQSLKEYFSNIDYRDSTITLTGTERQIKDATESFRVYYHRYDEGQSYSLIDHSTFTYLFLPNHGVVDAFRSDDSSYVMEKRIACALEGTMWNPESN
ncbi:SCO family protein [Alloyangia pacifica]|nr:SCO family protein [Alloyangia pacifica]